MTVKAEKVVAPTTGDVIQVSPMAIISAAVERGTDVDVLEKMFDLYERDQARIASQKFDAAMANFQKEVPPIHRNKKTDRYWYAPFEQVMEIVKPYFAANGLSVRFSTRYDADGYLNTLCTVAHTGGHKETSEFMCPVDKENKQKINVAQQQGSANSYGKRYALANALNLVFSDEDDDGQSAGTQYIDENQAANLQALIDEVGADKSLFLRWARSASLEAIAEHKYHHCVMRLEEMRK